MYLHSIARFQCFNEILCSENGELLESIEYLLM